jgi:cardiolipin synthase
LSIDDSKFQAADLETLIFSGDQYSQFILQSIERARESICISCYIFDEDQFGRKVTEALRAKSHQGVLIRLVVDGFGSRHWTEKVKPVVESEMLQIRVFHPLPWPFSNMSSKSRLKFQRFVYFLLNVNRRNHQKLWIFDGLQSVVGSRNINNQALEWRESSLVIRDQKVVPVFSSVFERVWSRSLDVWWKKFLHREKLDRSPGSRVLLNHTYSLRKEKNQLLLNKIKNAKNLIYLTTPYFFPTLKVLSQLRKKAREGVKVCILLPQKSDVWLSKVIAELQYQSFVRCGVEIWEYEPSILHAKTLIVDDWCMLGSSNFNQRSFFRDLEVDYCSTKKETLSELKSKFLDDLSQASRVSESRSLNLFRYSIALVLSKLFPSWF